MKVFWRFTLVAALLALGCWLWTVFFPNDETLIRQQLAGTARAASVSGSESPLGQLGKLNELTGCFTPDVELNFDVPRQGRFSVQGRDGLMALAAARVRATGTSIKMEFLDVTIQVGPDRESATAVLTARAQVTGERDFFVQEMKFSLRKLNRRWYINRVETVKTLAAAPTGKPSPFPNDL